MCSLGVLFVTVVALSRVFGTVLRQASLNLEFTILLCFLKDRIKIRAPTWLLQVCVKQVATLIPQSTLRWTGMSPYTPFEAASMNRCLLPSLTCFNIAKDASALWFVYALAPFMSWNSHLCLWPGGNWDAENSLSQIQPPWHLQLAGARAAGTWLLDASGLPRNHSSHACQSHFPEAPAMALTSTHWSLRMCDHHTLEYMNMLFGCSYYRTQIDVCENKYAV